MKTYKSKVQKLPLLVRVYENFFLPISMLLIIGCGLSTSEMENAKKLSIAIAESECECRKIKESGQSTAECTENFARNVRYLTNFYDVVKPSDSERKQASTAADEIRSKCN
ncbi:MAG: hypothetical protein IPO06_12590 [Leptospiraceae bacterium]|nr:hypothetical protein [Leptospiraceae bacterium]MBK9500189.1 hypothetical protein [Leptospiraceae bacterium]MBP9890034.1 hypothetical protein [Leptospiraceae bacterium]